MIPLFDWARKEVDSVVRLKRLTESISDPILDTTSTPEEETIMRLASSARLTS
jgi:hypothetical protein